MYYSFESLQNIHKGYSNFEKKVQKKRSMSSDPYPWLEPNDSRRILTERQIIESTIELSQSCLSKEQER